MAAKLILISSEGVFSSALMNHLSEALSMEYEICVHPKDFPVSTDDDYIVMIDHQIVKIVHSPWFEFFAQPNERIKVLLIDYPENEPLDIIGKLNNVHGVFFGNDSLGVLEKGIRKVAEGEMWFGRQLVGELLELYKSKSIGSAASKRVKISPRELEVLRCLAIGCSNQDVAEQLHLSENTVKSHLFNIFRKLNVKNRTQAVSWFNNHYGV